MTITLFDFLYWEATVLQRKPKSDGGGWECHCDDCSESLDMPDADGWESALAETRKAGWKSVQRSGSWAHLCPSCHESALAKHKRTP